MAAGCVCRWRGSGATMPIFLCLDRMSPMVKILIFSHISLRFRCSVGGDKNRIVLSAGALPKMLKKNHIKCRTKKRLWQQPTETPITKPSLQCVIGCSESNRSGIRWPHSRNTQMSRSVCVRAASVNRRHSLRR